VVSIIVLVVATLFIFNEFNSLQTQITNLQTQNRELESQNSNLQNQTSLLQDQNHELQDRINKFSVQANITAFTADMSWYNPVGVTMVVFFDFTVQNTGTIDISNATLEVQRITNGTDTFVTYDYINGNEITLHPNETRQIRVGVFTNLDHYTEVINSSFIASIKLNGNILDERKLF
jgi:FtsZ-binding cell division protein ZapB